MSGSLALLLSCLISVLLQAGGTPAGGQDKPIGGDSPQTSPADLPQPPPGIPGPRPGEPPPPARPPGEPEQAGLNPAHILVYYSEDSERWGEIRGRLDLLKSRENIKIETKDISDFKNLQALRLMEEQHMTARFGDTEMFVDGAFYAGFVEVATFLDQVYGGLPPGFVKPTDPPPGQPEPVAPQGGDTKASTSGGTTTPEKREVVASASPRYDNVSRARVVQVADSDGFMGLAGIYRKLHARIGVWTHVVTIVVLLGLGILFVRLFQGGGEETPATPGNPTGPSTTGTKPT